jgi:hypothetical protein
VTGGAGLSPHRWIFGTMNPYRRLRPKAEIGRKVGCGVGRLRDAWRERRPCCYDAPPPSAYLSDAHPGAGDVASGAYRSMCDALSKAWKNAR